MEHKRISLVFVKCGYMWVLLVYCHSKLWIKHLYAALVVCGVQTPRVLNNENYIVPSGG